MRLSLASLVGVLVLAPVVSRGAVPAEMTQAGQQVDALLDTWRFHEAETALAALQKAAPTAPETGYLDGYRKFLHGDYEGSVRALAAAAQAVPAGTQTALTVNIRGLTELAKNAADAIKDHREER